MAAAFQQEGLWPVKVLPLVAVTGVVDAPPQAGPSVQRPLPRAASKHTGKADTRCMQREPSVSALGSRMDRATRRARSAPTLRQHALEKGRMG